AIVYLPDFAAVSEPPKQSGELEPYRARPPASDGDAMEPDLNEIVFFRCVRLPQQTSKSMNCGHTKG
ncbi:MAG: hypothetical protein RLZZ282_565, partial [Verrucomicrobiota bacterium]